MMRACAGIVAVALMAAGCGQRGPLIRPQDAAAARAARRPAPPVPESLIIGVPLSPSVSESPDPMVSPDGPSATDPSATDPNLSDPGTAAPVGGAPIR